MDEAQREFEIGNLSMHIHIHRELIAFVPSPFASPMASLPKPDQQENFKEIRKSTIFKKFMTALEVSKIDSIYRSGYHVKLTVFVRMF